MPENTTAATRSLPFAEFIALIALMMSLPALSIDIMLPALPHIGQDLGVTDESHSQLVITFIFIGMAIAQVFYGPLGDSLGRKPAIYIGLLIFVAGCALSALASSFEWMLAGRVLQGVGIAAPRVLAIALVRDSFSGRHMSRVMSFVMSVFIIVPVIAPALGQGVLYFGSWPWIFWFIAGMGILTLLWFALRQPETLSPAQRKPLSLAAIGSAFREVLTHKAAMIYTLMTGLNFAAFLGYLSSAQHLFQRIYDTGELFPVYFAALALAVGGASIYNARVVMRIGMIVLARRSLLMIIGIGLLFALICLFTEGRPVIWLTMGYLFLTFFNVGILFGNLNALAMEPLGHVAGVAAGVVASLSTVIAIPFGILIGQSLDQTVYPLIAGFVISSILGFVLLQSVCSRGNCDEV